jgi:hypothetical protein
MPLKRKGEVILIGIIVKMHKVFVVKACLVKGHVRLSKLVEWYKSRN